MGWELIEKLNDDDKIYSGACIRFYNTEKSFMEHCALPCRKEESLDYIVSEIYGNGEYFQLTCLTSGKGGNITCILKRENGEYFVTGKEIKRMLLTDLYKVFINCDPKIDIE